MISALLIGSVSALFLFVLQWVTAIRNEHFWLIGFAPLAGVMMIYGYQLYGKGLEKGTDMVFESYENSKILLPWRIAPMIFFSTAISHLFGASIGREGTAIQYGATISAQFQKYFKLSVGEKQLLILIGIAAGFGSLFGTPWAGSVFAIEVVRTGKIRWKGIVPILLTTFIANQICVFWGAPHTIYLPISGLSITWLPTLNYVIIAGIIFGFASILFVFFGNFFKRGFQLLPNAYIASIIIGIVIFLVGYYFGDNYLGLGIPTIKEAFVNQLPPYDFLIKILLTTMCLRAGYKGGEVTPLFFVGATLGNALFYFIPIPINLLAGLGFIAVFAAATKTPIACAIMGMELFGIEYSLYFLTVCFISYYVAGSYSIYNVKAQLPYYFGLYKKNRR